MRIFHAKDSCSEVRTAPYSDSSNHWRTRLCLVSNNTAQPNRSSTLKGRSGSAAKKRARSFYRSRSTLRKKGLDDATGLTKFGGRLVSASRAWPERVITWYYQLVLLPITFLRLCDIGSERSFGT
jgi:hypothetical protein